ncbi:CorA family divalent cation transporter [Rhodosalinus sp.]|uniref:CorA family divalent cation transporter n=1 Tax=Rhodosalinus sp. TaxID=2047741 RepID=UPI003978976D
MIRAFHLSGGGLCTIAEQAGVLQRKTALLPDAMRGVVRIERAVIVRILPVVAVIFLPPALIAAICGMSFTVMPEPGWHFGHPMALGLMVASVLGAPVIFRCKGWF